jgi:hypothetical protein
MADTFLSMPEPRTDAEYEAAINEMFAEMDRLNKLIKQDDEEIEQSRRRTKELSAQSELWKKKTAIVAADNHARLERLMASLQLC